MAKNVQKKAPPPAAKNEKPVKAPEVQEEEVKRIPLAQLVPSPFQYRKAYPQKEMGELTESVGRKGVLQPIVVREVKSASGKAKYEVVFGHRRRLAAIAAGLNHIPGIVRNMTDEDVIEAQVIENDQRHDPNPIEQAYGYKQLIDRGKYNVESLATKINRTPQHLYGRLKLLDLPKEAQDAIINEKVPATLGLVLTRLKHESDQKTLLKEMLRDGGMTVRQAMNEVKCCSRDLTEAVFDTAACNACAFNARNQTALFPDLNKSGECSDAGCYFARTRDYYASYCEEMKKKGIKIVTNRPEVEKIRYGGKGGENIWNPSMKRSRYGSQVTVPPKYKSECAACVEHHLIYFCEETRYGNRKEIVFGEVCQNRACLNKMRGISSLPSHSSSGAGKVSEHTLKAHAEACRDRFTRKQLAPKIEAMAVLRKRLTLYLIMDKMTGSKQESFFKKVLSEPVKFNYDRQKLYMIIWQIPETQLDDILLKATISSMDDVEPRVLLTMTIEAGINMAVEFGPDKQYLNSLEKKDLLVYAQRAGLKIKATDKDKKDDIVSEIMKNDLAGKQPPRLKESIKLDIKVPGGNGKGNGLAVAEKQPAEAAV